MLQIPRYLGDAASRARRGTAGQVSNSHAQRLHFGFKSCMQSTCKLARPFSATLFGALGKGCGWTIIG